tara:strand:- start:144 stop:392 length:249 start_codon:yes stop_codon:yes gene_type:complete
MKNKYYASKQDFESITKFTCVHTHVSYAKDFYLPKPDKGMTEVSYSQYKKILRVVKQYESRKTKNCYLSGKDYPIGAIEKIF